MPTISYRIGGMDCAEEIAALRAQLARVGGVQNLSFDLLNSKMTVSFPEGIGKDAEIVAAVERAGMKAVPWSDARQAARPPTDWNRRLRTLAIASSGTLIITAIAVHGTFAGWRSAIGGEGAPLASRGLYLVAAALGMGQVLPKAGRALARLRPDMNLLMTAAVIGAVFIEQYLEAATVAFLFAVSLALEAWSVGRARRAIAALMALSPPTASVLKADGTEAIVDVRNVPVGATLLVKPGERFPLDGTISKGETTVDQSPITGESLPVGKGPGGDVFAGTINQDGAVEFVSTKPAEDTTLAHIIKLVGSAQSKRAPSEQWVEKFAGVYTPAVMLLAIGVMCIPPLLFQGSWAAWFYQGLVLLVIACPCALVISTPVSIVAAIATAARQGVLVKGGAYIEAPARLRAIAVDKTGTLTMGRPEVRQVLPLSGHTEEEVLEIAAAVEMRSEHPLARAIVRAAHVRGIAPTAAEEFQALKGKGATAKVGGGLVWLGSQRHLEERGQATPAMRETLEKLAAAGSSVVVVGNQEHVFGFVAVSDPIRPIARRAVQDLHAAGIERVVMLTGDNRGTGEAIGKEAGVDEIRAELLPADKVAAIEELVGRYRFVAMVGDGVNDAPAMARATVAIAMGEVGTDAALETADVALMSDDLSKLPWLIGHARRTLGVIRQNIFASVGVKVLFVGLTFAGVSTLWAAIAADTGTSLLVILNALRLLKY